jgi:HPt (histidine-containing phosphotransfer) domain-containing protein
LTPKEYSLLELFLRNPQRVFSRSAIIDRLWSLDGSPAESAVKVHIKELRQKLKTGGMTEEIIETVYGLGYRLKSPPEEKALRESVAGRGSVHREGARGDKGERSQWKLNSLASLSKVLERFRGSFAQQVGVLEQAKIALVEGNLSEGLRQSAGQEAHKLAGGLGTFGYPEGSNLARAIEHILMDGTVLGREEALRLDRLVADLQQELTKPPASFITEPTPPAQIPLVLVVDDDVALTEKLKVEAAVWGMQIETAPDLTTARQKIAQAPPDVILLELTFADPAEDGLIQLDFPVVWCLHHFLWHNPHPGNLDTLAS